MAAKVERGAARSALTRAPNPEGGQESAGWGGVASRAVVGPAPSWICGLALLALACLAHAPSIGGGWIVDDLLYVAENPLLDDAQGLRTIWNDPHRLFVYYPLTFTTFWVENQICGRDPRCFHATNVLLHALVALLAWRLLRRLELPGSWFAAALFAVHPIHVDTVAWVAERKNVLSGALALGSLLIYLDFDDRRERGTPSTARYLASLALFALALLAKTPVIGVPLVAALIVGWRRGRLARRDVAPIPPFLLVGAALASITVVVERGLVEAGDAIPSPALLERPFLAARATWFYVGKLLWPSGLSFDYGRWSTSLAEPKNALALVGLAAVALALWLGRRRWGFGPLVALVSFLVLAAPALGLVTFYFQRYSFVAGHFVYLASLPLLALIAAAGARTCRGQTWHGIVAASAALALLGALTWRHGHDYRDHETLGRAILRVNPTSWLAHNHLGNEALRRGEFASAIEHLGRAEQVASGRIETQINLALARMNAGDLAGAEAAARRAIELREGAALPHLVLGDALLRAGRFEEAVAAYAAALARDPASRRARSGLGIAQSRAGRHEAAVATLSEVLREDPGNTAARTGLAYSLVQLGRRDEAIAELERALATAPGDPRLLSNLELLRAGGPP